VYYLFLYYMINSLHQATEESMPSARSPRGYKSKK
jgi:hypothetical protein